MELESAYTRGYLACGSDTTQDAWLQGSNPMVLGLLFTYRSTRYDFYRKFSGILVSGTNINLVHLYLGRYLLRYLRYLIASACNSVAPTACHEHCQIQFLHPAASE